MPLVLYGVTTTGNVKTYFADKGDPVASYPTNDECGPGSEITIVDKSLDPPEVCGFAVKTNTAWAVY